MIPDKENFAPMKKHANDLLKKIRTLKAKHEKLLSEINLHDRLYYKEHNPIISDFEYDCLRAELERIHDALLSYGENTPDAGIGDDRINKFRAVSHLSPMLSLAKTYSREELFLFHERVKNALGAQRFSYIIEPKIDGIAINLIYKDGYFSQALTRGDGTIGDDVSSNVKTIKNLPLKIENAPGITEIRGEIYVDEKAFLETNKRREEENLPTFANPRNLAAGTLKTLNFNDIAVRNLKLITFSIGYCSNNIASLQSEILEYLKHVGFKSQEKYWVADDIHRAWSYVEELKDLKNKFSYWTDGAVLKINELDLYERLGTTAKSPRWAIAYKFEPERALTKINKIVIQVGRTGILTPVAEVETVQLSGTKVSRATLHNADEIAKKDIRVDDYVLIEKAGEIIPAIVSVDKTKRSRESMPFSFPKNCPACGSKLVRLPEEVAFRCQNSCCLPQVCRKIEHFASKSAMDIDGFGPTLIEKLMAKGKLSCVSDIYRLKVQDLANTDKFGIKSALKLLANIDNSKTRPLWRLLHAFGIPGIGEQTAKMLTKYFNSLDEIISAKSEQLQNVSGIGEKVSSAIISFFNEPHNAQIAKDLKGLGLQFKNAKQCNAHIKFNSKNFTLTGTLSSMKRQEAIAKIESLGGNAKTSLTKNTDILIAGTNSGGKLQLAQSRDIEIWSEEEFLKNIEMAH